MTTADAAGQIADTLGELLQRAHRAALYTTLTDGLAGVDASTYPVLSGLARTGPTTASRLAEQIGLDRSVVTRHADKLIRAGVVERSGDAHDGRASVLSLTPRGRALVAQLRRRLRGTLRQAVATWEPGEAARFADRLTLLTRALLDPAGSGGHGRPSTLDLVRPEPDE